MVSKLTISEAVAADVQQLVSLVNSAYRGESSKAGWTTEADLLGGIRIDETSLLELLNKPDAVILKCTNEENKLLGCVYLHQKKDSMYLGMLTVLPNQQASGIGKYLLSAAENHALQCGCSFIDITVISVRYELIAWYKRRGFQQTGEKLPFPNNPKFGIPKQPLEFVAMKKRF